MLKCGTIFCEYRRQLRVMISFTLLPKAMYLQQSKLGSFHFSLPDVTASSLTRSELHSLRHSLTYGMSISCLMGKVSGKQTDSCNRVKPANYDRQRYWEYMWS